MKVLVTSGWSVRAERREAVTREYDTIAPSPIWRVAWLELWSPVYGEWIRQNHTLTIKPFEYPSEVATLAALDYRVGTVVPRSRAVIWDR